MNRLITNNLAEFSPQALPPENRKGPVRILFLSTQMLGLKVFTNELEKRTQNRDDMDALHVRLVIPMWMKVLGKSIPGLLGYDFQSYRYLQLWRNQIRRWLLGPLDYRRFDLIHFTTQNSALAILDLPKVACPRLVIDIDATAYREVLDFNYGMFDRRPVIRAERKMFARADLIACWSEWARRSVVEDYGVPEDRTRVTRVGVSLPPASPTAIAEKNRNNRPLRLVFVGNDWERKGGHRLLKWHQEHWKDRAELHVIGADAPRDDATQNVIWHGFVPREKLLSDLLPSMDIFVLPTREDALALVLVEAQGLGIPVVASHMSGIATDAVQDGTTGILCDSKSDTEFIQAVEKLLDDPELRDRMGNAARSFVSSEWTADAWYNRHLDRLVELANSP